MDFSGIKQLLKSRFNELSVCGDSFEWTDVEQLLTEEALQAAAYMEETGGEPHILSLFENLVICDYSKESPKGRRSLCYDKEARLSRKKNPPTSSVLEEVDVHNLELLSESEYQYLQTIRDFDLKTSSWILTEESIRSQGGALFAEKRYGRSFIFANSADSYYSTRGFRAKYLL